jgi:hypothetical protein
MKTILYKQVFTYNESLDVNILAMGIGFGVGAVIQNGKMHSFGERSSMASSLFTQRSFLAYPEHRLAWV